ncbi:MAG: hypothetical protein RPU90_12150 [Candidatus Sedimenticola sp. (ex Thyasira tokunagai)]
MKNKAIIAALIAMSSSSALAEFSHVTMKQVRAAQTIVKAHGYRCDTVDEMQPFILGGGFTIYCNNWKYSYELEDKGGRWVVTVD